MKIKAKAGLAVLFFLAFLMPASAVISNTGATVDTTLTVSGLPQDSVVQFILNGGVPVFAVPDVSGNAHYIPSVQGATLQIVVMQGGAKIYDTTVTVQAKPVSGGGGGGPSGGGSGGGGVISGEPFDNILTHLTIEGNLIANTPVPFNFSKVPELGIYEIPVTGMENELFVSMRVELLKGTSKLVTSPPSGVVYKNVNIWPGSKRIKEALINFKVENSWLSNNNLAGSDVKLLKWDGSTWLQLETSEIRKDADFTYFEAKTSAFSPFAISAKVTEIAPTVTAPTPTPSTTATSTATVPGVTPIAKPPSMTWVYALVLIVLVAIVVYLYAATKKKEAKK